MTDDIYKDGEVSDNELVLLEQQRIDRRQNNQKSMAWVAIGSMIAFTVFMFLPIVGNTRIEILTEIASLFYIAQAGVIGAYMGSEALVNKSRNQVKK